MAINPHPEFAFAGRSTRAWSRSIGQGIGNVGYVGFPRWISLWNLAFWYIGNVVLALIKVALIAIWLYGVAAIWALQLLVFVCAMPWAITYAIQQQKRQHQLARDLERQYYVERRDMQVSVDDFRAWVREQEGK